MVTDPAGNRACAANTLPDLRWQSRQWQTETPTGAADVMAVSRPQAQLAIRFVSIILFALLNLALYTSSVNASEPLELLRRSTRQKVCCGKPSCTKWLATVWLEVLVHRADARIQAMSGACRRFTSHPPASCSHPNRTQYTGGKCAEIKCQLSPPSSDVHSAPVVDPIARRVPDSSTASPCRYTRSYAGAGGNPFEKRSKVRPPSRVRVTTNWPSTGFS
jgi:hypothetical protein